MFEFLNQHSDEQSLVSFVDRHQVEVLLQVGFHSGQIEHDALDLESLRIDGARVGNRPLADRG